MVFLEYDVDNAPYSRYGKWWAAYGGGGSVTLPLVMADSGHQFSYGYLDFHSVYKAMVDTEMARPPQAEIQTAWRRVGDKVVFYVQVKNLSGVTLSSDNDATMHVIMYEDVRVKLTNRFVVTVVQTDISSLAPNATAGFTLETGDLSGVDWGKTHYLALVDFRPGGTSGAYDMLQAAVAQPAAFAVEPESVAFMVDTGDTTVPPAQLSLAPPLYSWTAVSSAAWLTVTPANGPGTTQPAVSVVQNSLVPGWQQATVTFTADDGVSTDQVTVRAYLGQVERVFLPAVAR